MAISFSTRGGNYINAGSGSSIDNLAAFTHLTWFYPTDLTAEAYGLTGQGTWAGQNRKGLIYFTDGGGGAHGLAFGADCSTADMDANCEGAFTLSANTWYFAVGAWAGVGNAPHLYFGSLTTLAAETSYISQVSGTGTINSSADQDFFVGNFAGGVASMIGRMGVAMIWNRELSLGEVKDQQFNPHKTSGCVLYYQCGYGGTSSQPDWSGNGNTGTITNGSLAAHVPLRSPFRRSYGWNGAYTEPAAATGNVNLLQGKFGMKLAGKL